MKSRWTPKKGLHWIGWFRLETLKPLLILKQTRNSTSSINYSNLILNLLLIWFRIEHLIQKLFERPRGTRAWHAWCMTTDHQNFAQWEFRLKFLSFLVATHKKTYRVSCRCGAWINVFLKRFRGTRRNLSRNSSAPTSTVWETLTYGIASFVGSESHILSWSWVCFLHVPESKSKSQNNSSDSTKLVWCYDIFYYLWVCYCNKKNLNQTSTWCYTVDPVNKPSRRLNPKTLYKSSISSYYSIYFRSCLAALK